MDPTYPPGLKIWLTVMVNFLQRTLKIVKNLKLLQLDYRKYGVESSWGLSRCFIRRTS